MRPLLPLVLALMTVSVSAEPGDPVHLRPQVWRFGSSVQIEVHNHTDTDVTCRGTVHIHTRRGRFQSEYFSENIYRGQTRRATYRLWDLRDEVTYASEFINCREN